MKRGVRASRTRSIDTSDSRRVEDWERINTFIACYDFFVFFLMWRSG